MTIHFYIRFHTRYGESLWLGGNCPELGDNTTRASVPLKYHNYDYWTVSIDINEKELTDGLIYNYYFKNADGDWTAANNRSYTIPLADLSENALVIYDTWISTDAIENVFYTAPFTQLALTPKTSIITENNNKPHATATHRFAIKAPLLGQHECVCMTGNISQLGNWDTAAPLLLLQNGAEWTIDVDLSAARFPIAYKYGTFNTATKTFTRFEEKENRVITNIDKEKVFSIVQDGYIRLPNHRWKGAGVALPVFSLRSENSFGIGEFNDLRLLADWAHITGLKLIQILPVNDTSATFSWKDSYPYAAISAFALHPIYLNIATVAGIEAAKLIKNSKPKQEELNALPEIDYESVLHYKQELLKKIFALIGKKQLDTADYKSFYNTNKHWLVPYAVFCYLRDEYGTTDYLKWQTNSTYHENEIAGLFEKNAATEFHCFVQYHLHLQLKEAVAYAHQKGVVLKGDIAIGVYRYGADTWQAPHLYHMEVQAGAPPDDFAINGQNWGFPTYNWHQMQTSHFEWWQQRFEQMSYYFDAFRIDHILGFFRIWSIPMNAVQGIMGQFAPAIPIKEHEFNDRGIEFDPDRYCKPFINSIVLQQLFNDDVESVKNQFLSSIDGFNFSLLPEFDSQQKIEHWFRKQPNYKNGCTIKESLFQLVSNIILFKTQEENETVYHFRFAVAKTLSFQALPYDQQDKLKDLYNDYFFSRQDDFWRKESLKKLPSLKAATNMLICGEDLGLVPNCVPEVMQQLGILSLEIQRMPKQAGKQFFNPAEAPYLSVVSPSTHDMSTIRGWWEEDRKSTQEFYTALLNMQGEAPVFCEPWINRAIIAQHLQSPAMWSIFQLQDLMGIDGTIRRPDPATERINIPADPNHYWRYRMHISLEALLAQSSFNDSLKDLIISAGR